MSASLRNIFLIARYTFKEITQGHILWNTLLVGLGLLIVCYVSYSIAYGVPQKVTLDIGLGLLSLSNVTISLLIGANLVTKEIESRTLYLILTCPIDRYLFLVGRLSGLMAVIAINVAVLSGMILGLYALVGGEFSSILFAQILFSYAEAILVLLLVVLFSLLINNILAVLVTLSLFILGHAVPSAIQTTFIAERPIFKNLLQVYIHIFPDFSRINFKDFILYQQSLEWSIIGQTLLYVFFYGLFLLTISSIVFHNKDFD